MFEEMKRWIKLEQNPKANVPNWIVDLKLAWLM